MLKGREEMKVANPHEGNGQ